MLFRTGFYAISVGDVVICDTSPTMWHVSMMQCTKRLPSKVLDSFGVGCDPRGLYSESVNERMAYEGPPWANPHDRLDEIRRQSHMAIAAKIDADIALLEVSRKNIRRWAGQMGRMPAAYAEWLEVLERPWPEIRHILVSPDENSVRMRQSTPFSGILSQRERLTIRGTVGA